MADNARKNNLSLRNDAADLAMRTPSGPTAFAASRLCSEPVLAITVSPSKARVRSGRAIALHLRAPLLCALCKPLPRTAEKLLDWPTFPPSRASSATPEALTPEKTLHRRSAAVEQAYQSLEPTWWIYNMAQSHIARIPKITPIKNSIICFSLGRSGNVIIPARFYIVNID
jgi:hypothetical protein